MDAFTINRLLTTDGAFRKAVAGYLADRSASPEFPRHVTVRRREVAQLGPFDSTSLSLRTVALRLETGEAPAPHNASTTAAAILRDYADALEGVVDDQDEIQAISWLLAGITGRPVVDDHDEVGLDDATVGALLDVIRDKLRLAAVRERSSIACADATISRQRHAAKADAFDEAIAVIDRHSRDESQLSARTA